ncbi:MAG: putative ATP-grasp-modified RiPP [Streptosporangiaceae bacterium]
MSDPLTVEPFPLGRAFGLVGPSDDGPSEPETRPFGLTLAAEPSASIVPAIDPAHLFYDHEKQVALIREGDTAIAVMKHSSNKTRTSTSAHDRNPPDDDTDVGGD